MDSGTFFPPTTDLVRTTDERKSLLHDAAARIIADENRVRRWTLTIYGTDGEPHHIPLRCSRSQTRQIKQAVFAAGGDALAVRDE